MSESWPSDCPRWGNSALEYLINCPITDKEGVVLYDDIVEKSDRFPIEFPIKTVKCKHLQRVLPKDTLERNINSVYPLVHEQVLWLMCNFIDQKRKFGNPIERDLYTNLTLEQFIDRLLVKRAVSFVGPKDKYQLLDGTTGMGQWSTIGTEQESPPLILKDYLSYDEVKFGAYLSISSYTHFLNVGDRYNSGIEEKDRSKVQEEGIIIGLIGPRFQKPNYMDYQEIIVSKDQNIHQNGYGHFFVPTLRGMFVNFFGEPSLTYKEMKESLKDTNKYLNLNGDRYFNKYAYEKRLALSFDTLLIEANARAKEKNVFAFVHVVGIGLGVWRISVFQNSVFLETFIKRLQHLGPSLTNISDVCFAYITTSDTVGDYRAGDKVPVSNHPLEGIKLHIDNRNPSAKLQDPHQDKLLVVSYAWDGNALPGNEFWWGSLDSSGDPAAACSTQVAELHNPHINPNVSGKNLRIVTSNGLVTLKEYQLKIKNTQF